MQDSMEMAAPVNEDQLQLPGFEELWRAEWRGMPEFIQDDLSPHRTLMVHFESDADVQSFMELVGQRITPLTKYIWHPEVQDAKLREKRIVAEGEQPMFPLYIVSKGRWDRHLTHSALVSMGCPHYVVVEQQELEQYRAAFHPMATLLVLPPVYKKNYDTFDELGLSKSTGPGPARNFCWDHSVSKGFKWHWVMDDNITSFYRLNRNIKTRVYSGVIFRAMEEFCIRYSNIGMAGPNYEMFAVRKQKLPAFIFNTRIYSCNLIRNDTPFRWRGRYNEDTDLSLRMLKSGWCTIQFNAFLQDKVPTQTLKGGNTAEFYEAEGTSPKSEMLQRMHPDVARVAVKFGRVHHHVDYSGFKKLRLKWDEHHPPVDHGVDEFHMVTEQLVAGQWVRVTTEAVERPARYSAGEAIPPPFEGQGDLFGYESPRARNADIPF